MPTILKVSSIHDELMNIIVKENNIFMVNLMAEIDRNLENRDFALSYSHWLLGGREADMIWMAEHMGHDHNSQLWNDLEDHLNWIRMRNMGPFRILKLLRSRMGFLGVAKADAE